MIIEQTKYTIVPDHNRLAVLLDGRIEAKGFTDEESALHAVWMKQGKKAGHFYTVKEGVVYLMVEDPKDYDGGVMTRFNSATFW